MSEKDAVNDIYYKALTSKDRRFDGRVFFGVRTTGIYCRPVCPAKIPLRKNVTFHLTAASAEEAGYRPCLRCRPETSPNTPSWGGTSATISRALRLIHSGQEGDEGVKGLANQLGIGERHLRRLFLEHLGASPTTVIQVRRLNFARRLIDETELSMSEVAFASGFESIRRFNDAFKNRFRRSPSQARKGILRKAEKGSELTLKLAYRPPFEWHSLLTFLAARAVTGVECVTDGCYLRTIQIEDVPGWIRIKADLDAHSILLTIHPPRVNGLIEIIHRVTSLLDLDADPLAIARALSGGGFLKGELREYPGLRVPGSWDPFEIAVRAIVGQQISIAGARTILGRLVERFGVPVKCEIPGLRYLFPTANVLLRGNFNDIGLTPKRVQTIRILAKQVSQGRLSLNSLSDPLATREQLMAISGIGRWTAEYIAMRALRDPDAFPGSDLVIRRELAKRELKEAPDHWRPWRSYGALYLWKAASGNPKRRINR